VNLQQANNNNSTAVRMHPSILRVGNTSHLVNNNGSSTTKTSRHNSTEIGGQTFCYDEVFPESASQADVFQYRVDPLVQRCLDGYNATVLAYGQTSSGKTYTMTGPPPEQGGDIDNEQAGVIPRAVKQLFDGLEAKRLEHDVKGSQRCNIKYAYQVRVQFLELYMEDLNDLLQDKDKASPSSKNKVTLRMSGSQEPEVLGATKAPAKTAEEALAYLQKGLERRATGSTAMNVTSSRSHAIFSVQVEQTICTTGAVSKGSHVKKSQFHFCDLAGSERHKRTQIEGATEGQQRLMKEEVCQINKGLLALGNVISALGDQKRGKSNKSFVPYRDSKLTLLLKGSLGGNHHTLMIACVSPAAEDKEESLSCLRYANRAKNISNHVVVNVDHRSQLLDQLQNQMQSLAGELLVAYKQDNSGGAAFETLLAGMASGDKDESKCGKVTNQPRKALERDPNKKDSFFPFLTRAVFLQKNTSSTAITDDEQENLPLQLTGYEDDIEGLRNELNEATQELTMALASERNPPDDDDMSEISELSFPSRIETIESFASHDSQEIRSLRRRLCHRLDSLQAGSDEYQNMKLNYDKLKEMSIALQYKENARTDLMQRMRNDTTTPSTVKKSQTDYFQLDVSKHSLYATGIVYCSVLYCVASIIYKVY